MLNYIVYTSLPSLQIKNLFYPKVQHSRGSLSCWLLSLFCADLPSPPSSCTTVLQRERERRARLLSVGHSVRSVKSHYSPRSVVSSLCGSTHKDGSLLCQCLYYNINKDGWLTSSWTICLEVCTDLQSGSVIMCLFLYFLPLRFSQSRDAGRDVSSEGRCVTIATSWLTGRIVPFSWATGCQQQLKPVSCDHFLLLLMQREETPL